MVGKFIEFIQGVRVTVMNAVKVLEFPSKLTTQNQLTCWLHNSIKMQEFHMKHLYNALYIFKLILQIIT